MATQTDKHQKIDNSEDEDDQLLHKFLYDDKTIEKLASERGEKWIDTYHALLEDLGEIKDEH